MKAKYQTPYDDSVYYFSFMHLEHSHLKTNFQCHLKTSVAYPFNYPIEIFFKLELSTASANLLGVPKKGL